MNVVQFPKRPSKSEAVAAFKRMQEAEQALQMHGMINTYEKTPEEIVEISIAYRRAQNAWLQAASEYQAIIALLV